jgi:hypothetical protein
MPASATDPLARFLQSAAHDASPLPLVSTAIDVAVHGGLAIVTTERRFRNAETISIEATMTFPVPIDATLCSLSARIDGRTLHAVAMAREAARDTYERALSEGKSAVLHEEPLRGIHVLSVGHIAPQAEIAVVDTWTAPLSFAEPNPRLRIPTTVGEVYGRSPLPPSDDLLLAGPARSATMRVACQDGEATVRWATSGPDGAWSVPLDRPIEIVIAGWRRRPLKGISASGRAVTLDIAPAAATRHPLTVDILVDRSGSMNEMAEGTARSRSSKFEIATAALCAAARNLQPDDTVSIWEFNDSVDRIGEAKGPQVEAMARRILGPDGGTEIGVAIGTAVDCGAKNLLIVTDGASWALDPLALAATGLRLTAVLVGEDALEAQIAHLASLTGGQVFVASGADTAAALAAALSAARTPFDSRPREIERLDRIETLRRGAKVVATWGAKARAKPSAHARRIGATAAALVLPFMSETAATELAVAEGLVTHLTSLVLVDEAAEAKHGVPARRRVPLSRAQPVGQPVRLASASIPRECGGVALALEGPIDDGGEEEPVEIPLWISLRLIARRIDWDADPDALCRGELASVPIDVLASVVELTRLADVVALATALSMRPMVVVIGLAAHSFAAQNRSAERVAKAILGAADLSRFAGVLAGVERRKS